MRRYEPIIRMPQGWVEIDVPIQMDISCYYKAHHEQEVITLPHGKFFVDSYWVAKNSVEIYLRPVPETWELKQ